MAVLWGSELRVTDEEKLHDFGRITNYMWSFRGKLSSENPGGKIALSALNCKRFSANCGRERLLNVYSSFSGLLRNIVRTINRKCFGDLSGLQSFNSSNTIQTYCRMPSYCILSPCCSNYVPETSGNFRNFPQNSN